MIKVIKYYELNRISRILVIAIITYIIGILIKREYEESKEDGNYIIENFKELLQDWFWGD